MGLVEVGRGRAADRGVRARAPDLRPGRFGCDIGAPFENGAAWRAPARRAASRSSFNRSFSRRNRSRSRCHSARSRSRRATSLRKRALSRRVRAKSSRNASSLGVGRSARSGTLQLCHDLRSRTSTEYWIAR